MHEREKLRRVYLIRKSYFNVGWWLENLVIPCRGMRNGYQSVSEFDNGSIKNVANCFAILVHTNKALMGTLLSEWSRSPLGMRSGCDYRFLPLHNGEFSLLYIYRGGNVQIPVRLSSTKKCFLVVFPVVLL
ncbi:hypothetical protein TNCV_3377761 [Trichonephila clavipes]|nr:hypothetical protein TNCV_3377761 [Trichonephila clavipes]